MKKKFPDLEDWRKMSVKDLKKILDRIGESKSGKKAELYQRIMDYLQVGGLTDNLQLPLSQLRSLIPVFRVKYQDVCLSKQQIKDITAKSYLQKEDLNAWITHHETTSSWIRQGESWKLIFLGNGNLDLTDSTIEQFINNIIKVQTLDGDSLAPGKIRYFKDRDADSEFQTQEIWEETCRKILLSCNQRLSLKKCEELLGEIPSPQVWGVQLANFQRAFKDSSQYSPRS